MTTGSVTEALLRQCEVRGEACAFPLLEVYEELGSTNDRIQQLAATGAPDGSLVLADRQTAGRGRRGRNWESPAGANLAFSLLLRPRLPLAVLSETTLLAAVAVREAIRELTGLQPQIKWPNDLLIAGRKCCGILTELRFMPGGEPYLILGIGVNVRKASRSPLLADTAVSLEEAGGNCSRSALAAAVYRQFISLETTWESCGSLAFLQESYTAALAYREGEVKLLDASGEMARGRLRGIDDTGALLLETKQGPLRVTAGEISLRPV